MFDRTYYFIQLSKSIIWFPPPPLLRCLKAENIPRIFYMAAGWSRGGSFDEINGHCYLRVIRAVFNINNQSTLSVISLWLSEASSPLAPPFSFHIDVFRDLPESSEKLQLRLGPKWREPDYKVKVWSILCFWIRVDRFMTNLFLNKCFYFYKKMDLLSKKVFRKKLGVGVWRQRMNCW